MTRCGYSPVRRIIGISGALLLVAPRLAVPAVRPPLPGPRTFAEARRDLVQHRLNFVLEEPPFDPRPGAARGEHDPGDLPGQFAAMFDYSLDRQQGILLLHKRYTDSEDRPTFSLEELAAVGDQLLPLAAAFPVDWNGDPLDRFIRSFSRDDVMALEGHSTPVAALSPAQRKLLDNFGLGHLFATSFGTTHDQLRALRSILARPEAVRLVWEGARPKGAPLFWCYYADDSLGRTPRWLILVAPGNQPPDAGALGSVRDSPTMVLPIPPGTRRLPYKVSIHREAVTVGDVLDEIRSQVSVGVEAPAYFRARRVSVAVRQIEVGTLLDALGALFGWQWDASREGRARLARPRLTPSSVAQLPAAMWSGLPLPLRAHLEPRPDRGDTSARVTAAAARTGGLLYEAAREKLGRPEGLAWADFTPEIRERFVDWLTYGLLATSFRWNRQRVAPWLLNPAQTVVEVAQGAFVHATPP